MGIEEQNKNKTNEVDAFVYQVDPLQTYLSFLKLHQCFLSSFSTNIEDQYKVNVNEFRVLMMVGRLGVTASHEIVEATGIHIMAVSRTVTALERRGYVAVNVDADNRRRKRIKLTERGQDLYQAILPAASRIVKNMFEPLRVDELLTFDHHLKSLNEKMALVDEQESSGLVEKAHEELE